MVDILLYISADPEARKEMDNEAYWLRYEECTAGELIRNADALAQKDGVIAQKDNALAEKEKEIENLKKQIEQMKK
jgi:chromosome segregation ATPase